MLTASGGNVTDLPVPGLLRLAPETRHRIYQHAGLGYKELYDLRAPAVYNLGEQSNSAPFRGLLLSCRTIYTEASALLYSANWFMIRYQPRRSLKALRILGPRTLACLTHLKVILNQTSCHQRPKADAEYEGHFHACCSNNDSASPPCCSYWHVLSHVDSHDMPLDGSADLTNALLEEWRETVAYLASHVVPGQLELTLVCDVHRDDIEVAKHVVDGLRLLPLLKDCHVRLCGKAEPRFQQLAQEAALQACGIKSCGHSAGPYLLNLPSELQLRILQFTDLITPYNEVVWMRTSRGYRIERAPCAELIRGHPCPPEFHNGCQFNQCWEKLWWKPSIGCFCRRRHAAFSSQCRCWAPPTPLFLVCRALNLAANRIFYSENRFIVIDGPSTYPVVPRPPGDYPHKSFAASQFLQQVVPPHCLGHLRFLEVVFAPFVLLNGPLGGHPALVDWFETLNWAKGTLNLPALSLRLIVARDSGNHEYMEMTRAQGKDVLAVYNSIVHSLRCLGPTSESSDDGLARFYAELACLEVRNLGQGQVGGDEPQTTNLRLARIQGRRAQKTGGAVCYGGALRACLRGGQGAPEKCLDVDL